MITLRPYQIEAIEALRQGVREGHKKQILCAPTGSGKTECAMALIQEAIGKSSKTAFICDRIAILDQTSQRFDNNNIPHGIIQAGHWRFKPWEYAQICSAQTLARRGVIEGLKLIVVDEAHTCYRTTIEFIKAHPEIVTVGLTATPFTKGLGEIYSNIVNITTTNKLIEEQFLAPLTVYVAKTIDMRGAKLKFDGEWMDDEIEKRGLEIVGDVVQEWLTKTNELFGGPVKTICFSATVAHGAELCRQFQLAGHNFQQVSYMDGNDDSRRALIERFRETDSDVTGLVSVEALAKGFDVPDIRCLISAKPYRKSLSGHIQQIGRGMRPSPGKEFCCVLDHAGNMLRFYDDTTTFFERGLEGLAQDHLDSTARKEPEEKEIKQILCGNCKVVLSPSATHCPVCGWERPRRKNDLEHLPGEMVELDLKGAKKKDIPEWLQNKQDVACQIWAYALERKNGDRLAARKFANAQFRNLYGEWPYRRIDECEPMDPHPMLVRKIRSQLIRWAKRREKESVHEHVS